MVPATAPAIDRTEKARDFHAWPLDQAKRLRLGDIIDRESLAEELEAMAARERRELLSHLEVWTFDQLINPDFWPGKKVLSIKP
jgi:hypothetical protein